MRMLKQESLEDYITGNGFRLYYKDYVPEKSQLGKNTGYF